MFLQPTCSECFCENTIKIPATKESYRVYVGTAHKKSSIDSVTLAARGLEERAIFAIIVSFMLFTVFTIANVLYFEEFMIHD